MYLAKQDEDTNKKWLLLSTALLNGYVLCYYNETTKKRKKKQVQGYILYSFQQVKYDFRKFILKHQYPLVAGLYCLDGLNVVQKFFCYYGNFFPQKIYSRGENVRLKIIIIKKRNN